MGCASSKTSVQEIEIQDGKTRRVSSSKTRKAIHVEATEEYAVDKSRALVIGQQKATSAKSRDSGIQEMENVAVTEYSDPNHVDDTRPRTPDFKLVGKQFESRSAARDRQKSKTILQELEAQGLIQGSRVQTGGAAFDVSLEPIGKLQPLAPVKKPPPRLERLNSGRRKMTREELDQKLKEAESRRIKKHSEKSKSRIASQLRAHVAMSRQTGSDGEDEDEVHHGSNHHHHRNNMLLPPMPPRSNMPTHQSFSKPQETSMTHRKLSDPFSDDLSSLEDSLSITNNKKNNLHNFNDDDEDDDDFY